MKEQLVDEIINCLSEDKRRFYYHKDRYAILLLEEMARYQNDIKKIKKSSFAKLLNKPFIKEHLSKNGQAQLNAENFATQFNSQAIPFTVSFFKWGDDDYRDQTSREGFNLVVQLNFSSHHEHEYQRLYKPSGNYGFNSWGHPIYAANDDNARTKKHRETMAWARIDLDFRLGEAVIEEVQCDWLRFARSEYKWLKAAIEKGTVSEEYFGKSKFSAMKYYFEEVLKPYEKIWDEAILSVALEVILRDIGINKVYYHTYESGSLIKDIDYGKPPRSLYTNLPKRFCFQKSKYGPDFIEKTRKFKKFRKQYPFLEWQKLDIQGAAYA